MIGITENDKNIFSIESDLKLYITDKIINTVDRLKHIAYPSYSGFLIPLMNANKDV